MKHFLKNSLAVLLALLMLFEAGQAGFISAAKEIDKAINPAKYIELTVPERFQDGENWFFIPATSYTASEKSNETIYVPIQRTGDLDAEAEITLKVIDLSARHDVNYTAEIYREDVNPETVLGGDAIVDLIQNADGFEEIETVDDRNELGEMIHEAGGAELVDGEGNTVATITANKLDENGNPIVEADEEAAEEATPAQNAAPAEEAAPERNAAPAEEAAPAATGAVEEGEWTDGKKSSTDSLREARDAFTGTSSDRQELNNSTDLSNLASNLMDEEEFNEAMAESVTEDYPGKEYRLTFAPGEEAKFLAVTPIYSDAAEGDMQIILMLKDPGEGYRIGEDVNPVTINITDEDEPEPVYIDMAAETVVAEDGKAVITVNRSGRVNAIKGVVLSSWGGSAEEGNDYSGIGAKLYFGMGVNTRSVEIPVYHGTEEKDFYLTITALDDEQVTVATTHVIIPAAEPAEEGELMGINSLTDSNGNVHPFSDAINVKSGSIDWGNFKSDTTFHLYTKVNVEHGAAYYFDNITNYGCAYDGMYVHFNSKVRWCWADFRLVKWNGGNPTWMHVNNFDDDEGDNTEYWLYAAWDSVQTPDKITVEAADVDKYGPVGTDSYVEMDVDEVKLIKRQFEIKLEPAVVKPLIGVDDIDVLRDYESVYLDGTTVTSKTHWTDDSFSITTTPNTNNPLRLVGMEAKTTDGKWVRIATIDGKSSSAVVILTPEEINSLQNRGVIRWSTNGKFTYSGEDAERYTPDKNITSYSGNCYKGTITVRPVFDYIDVNVEVVADRDGYGTLNAPAPIVSAAYEPSLLWEFGSNNNMNGVMHDQNEISRTVSRSGSGTFNGYYSFYASGDDPYVYVDTPCYDASAMGWVKIRARHDAGSASLQLFADCTGMGWYGNSCENIPLESDSQWHEYVHKITNAQWKNKVNWLRLDPLAGGVSGKHIDIDYIAFFPDEASARAYDPQKSAKKIFDFNGSTMSMDNNFRYTGGCTWSAYEGDDTDAYKFTSDGGVTQFALTIGANSASEVRYLKMRIKNLNSKATNMRMYASIDNANLGPALAVVNIENDSEWREYVVDLTQCQHYDADKWNGAVSWARFDLGWENESFAIDYIAFFADEASANEYQPADGRLVELTPGTYTYHLGDRLGFTSTVSEKGEANGMVADGVQYELRTGGSTGNVVNSNLMHYINGTIDLRLAGETSGGAVVDRPFYKIKPTFTQEHNQLVVTISDADWNKLDTTKGILADDGHVSVFHEGGSRRVVVANDVRSNEIYALNVVLADGTGVPTWTTADGMVYSGEMFYAMTNPLPEENVIRLAVPDSQKLGYVTIFGTVATATFNMNTDRSASDINLAKDAWIAYGEVGTWSDEDGNFELNAVRCVHSSRMRFLVDYNGTTTIKEVIVPSNSARTYAAETQEGESVKAVKSNAGTVMIESFSQNGARFKRVVVDQTGRSAGTVDALVLNGKWLTATVTVEGGEYVLNNQTYTENVTDVTVFFMDQTNGMVHGIYSSNETPAEESPAKWEWVPDGKGGGTFTLNISTFGPDSPNEWTYGDVLMAQLTTDRKTVTTFFTGAKYMSYEPVSSGYAVISDPDYVPATFDYDIDSMAEMFDIEPVSDEDGDLLGDDKRASFGAFPYIGEITAAIHVFSFIASSATHNSEMKTLMKDLNSMSMGEKDEEEGLIDAAGNLIDWGDDESVGADSATDGKGGTPQRLKLSILVKFDETFYGGVRFMLGVIVAYGGGKAYEKQRNPFKSYQTMKAENQMLNDEAAQDDGSFTGSLYGSKDSGISSDRKERISEFGGLHFEFHAYVGIYIDFGYIELKELDSNGNPQKSHDAVFMGAGGFIGFGGNIGYTWAFLLAFLPAYINAEAGLELTVFLGATADPDKTLDEYEKLDDFKDKSQVHAQDYSFNFDFKGRIYVSVTFGVGLYKIIGVRVTGELAFEFGYSNKVVDWWPELFDSGWGYVMEVGFAGTIDLIVTSIDLYSASWPLPVGGGYLRYFQELRRANKCISYVEKGISDGKGTQADRDTAYQMCRELEIMVDQMTASREEIEAKTKELKNYAYDHEIITWTTKNAIEMNKQGGLVGTAMNAALQDDVGVGLGFHTNPHVHSTFVGNDGELQSAYGPVSRSDIVTDAYAQPSSKIISIGGGKFLVTFLDDTVSRDTIQAATLKWTIYDSSDGSFTEPQVVQNDSTADSRPHLADAGDKVILSWASSTDEKYDALKATVAEELRAATGVEPSPMEVEEALEADPARVLSIFDIFSVEFDKTKKTFGEITQLTDDEYYDDYPQAVYDAETRDYIVIYNKTAQDDADYDKAADRLYDLVGAGPNPEKTYSVISYMLYNGVQEEGDPYDVGWVTEGFYPNELPEGWTSDDYLAAYGPERFLPSTIQYENGSYADPPISDLTVAAGLDHLAAFAFTVDKDFDLDTSEDKELYVEYYNFKTHGIYYPLRVAGDKTVEYETFNSETQQKETRTATIQVDVGAPKFVRNGGSTFLFWREDGKTLKYLNVSEMLNAKVAGTADDNDGSTTEAKDGGTCEEYFWKYAVQADGTFAVDAVTGKAYVPNAIKVDFGSALTDSDIEITDYEVITDEDDNLYVVWTDTVARADQSAEEPGGPRTATAQEIYAAAMIKQDAKTVSFDDGNGETVTTETQTARWSKPYRITRDDEFNDGVALALDEDGGLIIVHNRYDKEAAKSEEEAARLVQEGKIGLTQDKEGNIYAATLTYNTPVTLSVTRCEKIGSLEATKFEFSDGKPVAGETVKVTAAIENVGLIDAEGCEIDFYEYKDGVRGNKIGETRDYDETITVNTARRVSFLWTVPEDGAEGYSIEAVIREKNPEGGFYDSISSFSDAFVAAPDYYITITDAVQEGDQFRIGYRVANCGNAPAAEGTTLSLELQGLYGGLDSERYGNVKDGVLYSADVTDKLNTKTVTVNGETGTGTVVKSVLEEEQYVTIPASVFRFCGYDAIKLFLTDPNGEVIAESDQKLVAMDAPMNLSLNGGKALDLNAGEEASAKLSYDTTAFVNNDKVIYVTEDPNVAEVDENGNVTAVGSGTTTLTATALPSGRMVEIEVRVDGGAQENPFEDVEEGRFFYDAVLWAYYHDPQITSGITDTTFSPYGEATRGQVVTFLYRAAGNPEPKSGDNPFTDVEEGRFYYDAVLWAAGEGITNGKTDTSFSPGETCTRGEFVTFLYRFAGKPDVALTENPFEDVSAERFYYKPVLWAVEQNVTTGTSATTFSPNKNCTRGEIVTFLYRYMGRE